MFKNLSRVIGWLLLSGAVCASACAATLTVGQPNGPCPNAQYTTIGAAISAANSGDVIQICPAVYPEQLSITTPLTLQGISTTVNGLPVNRVLIQPTLQVLPGIPSPAVISVGNTQGVTIENVAIDASHNTVSGCGSILAGIHFFNASGTIRNNAIFGAQLANPKSCYNSQAPISDNGIGVFINNGSAISSSSPNSGSTGPSQVTVENNSIHDFTSYGVWVAGTGITATVEGNTISGVGPSTGVFQFGVVIANGAVGQINSNVITEGLCGSLAILDCYNTRSEGVVLRLPGDGTVVNGNTISNVQSGIFLNGGNNASITNNQIQNVQALSGMDIAGFTNSQITGNTISNVGPIDQNASNDEEGCGINEYSGSGLSGNTISNNTVSDAYCGVAAVQADHIQSGMYFNTLYTQLDSDLYPCAYPPAGEPVALLVIGPGGAISITNTFQTASNQITLDASQSISSNPGTLTFSWAPSPGFPSAAIISANTARPTFQLPSRGKYQFTLMVMDATGAKATTTVTVQYI